MDANQELSNMRQRLRVEGYDSTDIEDIVAGATQLISEGITDVISDALNRAQQVGESMGAYDFLAQMRVINTGSSFAVTTDSGELDFSEPPFPMLPHLLKTAKTAKDGSQYKRIPIQKNKGQRSVPASTAQAAERMRSSQETARAEILENVGQTADALAMPRAFADASTVNRPKGKKERYRNNTPGGPVEFATASSKQDASTKWVIPEKNMDMTAAIADINSDLNRAIDEVIINITQNYRG
jgi:hypothetical protein